MGDQTFFDQVRAFMRRAEEAGVTLVPCSRCGVPCEVAADQPSEAARIARYADTKVVQQGVGMCMTCTVTGWLKDGPLAELITVEKLRDSRVQRHMAELYDAAPGHNDGASSEINWEAMIANWDLPLPKIKRQRKPIR